MSAPLPPGSTIGILGGGQLGRMTALAAARLGYRTHVFCPEPDAPASQVSGATTRGAYDDPAAQVRFAAAVDVITYEFENIPLAPVEALACVKPVRPSPGVLAICQDRIREKHAVNAAGIATARFAAIETDRDLAAALATVPPPAILKTARLGYDGKGQARVADAAEAAAAFARFGRVACVLEGIVDFTCEVSVIAARGRDGAVACYPTVENRHKHHILDETIAPAALPAAVAQEAERIARTIATRLDVVGLLAVEMFVTRDGRVLVNELAPRPHNSGHWTIDACVTNQFEQLVRAVAGLPLGSPERHSDAVMKNLIGDEVLDWPRLAAEPGACLHLYGKAEPRPGRKMGHVTRLVRRADRT
ncbi:MAG: 5-(carboxyamino)imidazole ribonucleotide synthase [Alphaproteobacteria bacterium]|nr:5-(carboxyamino)imidazole ribonucleotide synthase [Alphaproteobacteria bacterium]